MSHCPFCNSELEQYVFHEGSRSDPPTTTLECVVCGPLDFKTLLPVKMDTRK